MKSSRSRVDNPSEKPLIARQAIAGSLAAARPIGKPDLTASAGGGQGPAEQAAFVRRELAALLPELRAYARFLVRDRAHSDDLVQDSVVRALGAMAQFQPGSSLKAWVFTILRNAFFEQARRRRREAAAMAIHADSAAGGLHAGGLQQHHGEISDISRMLWTLPPLLREALVLVGAQELTHEEAAAVCSVPVGTMRARVSRARSKLADAFGDGSRPWEL